MYLCISFKSLVVQKKWKAQYDCTNSEKAFATTLFSNFILGVFIPLIRLTKVTI
jgi:hypothetical protein